MKEIELSKTNIFDFLFIKAIFDKGIRIFVSFPNIVLSLKYEWKHNRLFVTYRRP